MPEIYVSTDVETDGPIPGLNSMLSFGSAAYLADKTLLSTFSANLELLSGAAPDPKTMDWWATEPVAWEACRQNLQTPETALPKYLEWLKALPGKPVFVGYPVAFDFMFVYWYLIRFAGESPFSHSALDMKTLAMVLLKTDYRSVSKRRMPGHWFDNLPHTHLPLMMPSSREHCSAICWRNSREKSLSPRLDALQRMGYDNKSKISRENRSDENSVPDAPCQSN